MWSGLVALVSIGTAVCAAGGSAVRAEQVAAVAASDDVVVLLHAAAVVTSDDVTLADLADLTGEAARLLGPSRIAAAPAAGQTLVLDLADLQDALSGLGVNLGQWMFRGSSRCTISRPLDSTRASSATGRGEDAASTAPPGPGTGQRGPDLEPVDPNTLEGVLRSHIAQRLTGRAGIEGQPVIRFSPAAARPLALSKPTFDFEVVERADRLLGLIAFEVKVLEAGQVAQTVPILVEVSVRVPVVIAARAINRGETIRPGDLVLEERVFDRLDAIGLQDIQPLIGQRARRFVDQKAMVSARDLEPVPLVVRNDLVTVVARRGGILVRGSAKAMSSAGMGEAVPVRNEVSRESFTGIVIGPRTVELPDQRRKLPAATVLAQVEP